ncbi:RNA polymerase sigma factor [Candidatus Omnitrophota bacterium]
MRGENDADLVEQCLGRNRRAWQRFVEKFGSLVFWAIKDTLQRKGFEFNRQDIEEVFQDVFVLLWEKGKLEQIKNRNQISAWLAMVAANRTLNYLRKKRVNHINIESQDQGSLAGNSDINHDLEAAESQTLLAQAFSSLEPKEIITLKLSYFFNKTHQEIAEILKMPTNSISSIVRRSKDKLKQSLTEQGFLEH